MSAALEAVFAAEPLPPADQGWRAYLEAEAWARWALLRRYVGLIRKHETRLVTVSLRRVEHLVGGLVSLGFGADDALLAVDSVLDLVHDGAEQTAQLRGPDGELAAPLRTLLELAEPGLRASIETIVADPEAHMRRKLAIVLDGIGARLAP